MFSSEMRGSTLDRAQGEIWDTALAPVMERGSVTECERVVCMMKQTRYCVCLLFVLIIYLIRFNRVVCVKCARFAHLSPISCAFFTFFSTRKESSCLWRKC